MSDLDDRPADEFAETLRIAELLAQCDTANEHDLLAEDGDLEDLTWCLV